MQGTIMGAIQGDTGSLDHGSYRYHYRLGMCIKYSGSGLRFRVEGPKPQAVSPKLESKH